MDQYRRGDLTFDVVDAGPPDGPVVVLLHGFPETNAMWAPLTAGLTAAGYRCVAPNQRGYSPGARPTRRRDYRMSEQVDDVVALLDIIGAPKVHLIGHDWGAAVAWSVAQRHADRLASLTAMSVPHPGALMRAIATSRQGLASWYMFFFQLPRIPEWYILNRRGPFTAAAMLEQRKADAQALVEAEVDFIRRPGALTGGLNWYRAIPLSDVGGSFEKVSAPSLFIWGDDDVALRRRGVDLTPKYVTGEYRLEVLRGVSHWILDDHLDGTAAIVLDWLAAHPAD